MQSVSEHLQIAAAKVLVVGAGGIGCELLKTLAMTGFRHLEVIDLDTIETSNLNRQFLFRQRHVGHSKASVAAAAVQHVVLDLDITAHQANVKEARFSPEFVAGFNLVLNGLDNLEARRHVNRLCLAAGVPLVESGTAGYLGQVSVHVKGKTECFECQPKPVPKSFPVCTIRNTPDKPIHCIVWAKDLLFARLFGPPEAVSDLDDAGKAADSSLDCQALPGGETRGEGDDAAAGPPPSAFLRLPEEDPAAYARRVFTAVFETDISRLAAVEDMWKARHPPKPVAVDLAAAAQRVRALEWPGPAAGRGVTLGLGLGSQQSLWTPEENASVFLATVQAFLSMREEELGSLRFDKDDELAIEFVTAAANLRALCYGIAPQTLFDTKGMAGNIIHAVATTNAIASGLIVIEALKLLAGQLPKCHTTFLLAEASNQKLLTPMASPEPRPGCVICGTAQLVLCADLDVMTLGDVVAEVLKGRMALVSPTLVSGSFMYEEGDDLEEDEVEMNTRNLGKVLSQLPGGGLATGSVLEVSDQAQQLTFRLVLRHQGEWDEDVSPERWEVKGQVPTAAAQEGSVSDAGAGGEASARAGEDEDDLEIVEEVARVDKPASALHKRSADGAAEVARSKRRRGEDVNGNAGNDSDSDVVILQS